MLLGLKNREAIRRISPELEDELDSIINTMSRTFTQEHDAQGHHTSIRASSIRTPTLVESNPSGITPAAIAINSSGQHWTSGPWIFDNLNGVAPDGVARAVSVSNATYNDMASIVGLDNTVILEITPSGDATITGIQQTQAYKRVMMVGNVDPNAAGKTITLKHENAGSKPTYRFSLPGGVDIVLANGQYAWLYWTPVINRWVSFITPNYGGGIVGAGSISLPTGIDISAAALSSLGLTAVDFLITDAMMKALNTTPQTILAAPGAGYTWRLVSWAWTGNVTVTGGTAVNGSLRYVGGSPANRTIGTAATFVSVVGNRNGQGTPVGYNTQVVGDSIENLAVQVFGSANAGVTYASTSGMRVNALFQRGLTQN